MADLAAIEAALRGSHEVDEWIASARRERHHVREVGAARVQRMAETTTVNGMVFRDLRRGRGAARFAAVGDEAAAALVHDAAERAALSVGPPWHLPPPSAPARAPVADDQAYADPDAAVGAITDALLGAVSAAGVATTRLEISLAVVERELRTSAGLARTYRSTLFDLSATLIQRPGGARAQPLRLCARRADDLAIQAEVTRAATLMADRARATRLAPGPCDVLLTGAALADAADRGYGLWQPLVAQANAASARRGLARYRIGQSIYGEAQPSGEVITARSDGTLAYGLRSAPLGELGEPVRPFDLVRAGVAAGHPLGLIEAALAGEAANGGARNLIIESGPTPLGALSAPGARRLIEIALLGFLDVDAATGDFAAAVRLGYTGADHAPVTGAILRGNLFDALLRARFSRETTVRGWYYGPEGIRFDGLALLA